MEGEEGAKILLSASDSGLLQVGFQSPGFLHCYYFHVGLQFQLLYPEDFRNPVLGSLRFCEGAPLRILHFRDALLQSHFNCGKQQFRLADDQIRD